MTKSSPKPDDRVQSARFIKLAREIGATRKPEEFEQAFRKVATASREAPKRKASKKR